MSIGNFWPKNGGFLPNERTHLDLFSGIGGFALAAQWAGYRTIAFCEREPFCQAVLKKQFGGILANADGSYGSAEQGQQQKDWPEVIAGRRSIWKPVIFDDIYTLDGTQFRGVDLLTGGFPCQPFSCAGKRRGAEDDRYLWPEMLRVIKEARPHWVLGENVAGIINLELDSCISDLETAGYSVQALIIPACAVDARHRRDRVWIMAHSCSAAQYAGFSNGGYVPDANKPRSQRRGGGSLQKRSRQRTSRTHDSQNDFAIWPIEPAVGRVANGIPARVDRLKSLGNSIVPEVAYQIIKAITETEERQPA